MLTFLKLGEYGRLGNQFFQVASTIGIATKHGYDYSFPQWINHDHLILFNSGEDIEVWKHFEKPLPIVPAGINFREHGIGWGFQNVSLPNENISLVGHMQSEKYFKHCEPLIRDYFKLKPKTIPEYFTRKHEGQRIVGIHLRLGDYVAKKGYHPVQSIEYYHVAMALFPCDAIFIVFSDDIPAAKEIFGDTFYYAEGNDTMTDFWLMTQCTDFIIANSTLSWWGAWLINNPDKKVIAPSNWFGPEANGLPAGDIYADGWIVI